MLGHRLVTLGLKVGTTDVFQTQPILTTGGGGDFRGTLISRGKFRVSN